jgi:DNA-binding FadR family transcriptional regulator
MSILEHIAPVQGQGPTKAQEIAGKLETLIIESQLEAGALLATKEDLRRRFEVSPATMNEAIRILESCSLIVMRPGVKGGIFVATNSLRIALRRTLLELNRRPARVQECWVVFKWLERLVLMEAINNVTDDAVLELNQLLDKIAASLDQPATLTKWSWRLSQKIAGVGSNYVLTAIYTALLNVIEAESEEPWRPACHTGLAEAAATYRRVVDAIASKDEQRLFSLPESTIGAYAYT